MTRVAINTNDIQQLVQQIFGNREITAVTTENTVFLTTFEQENVHQDKVLNKLCGMFKNTNLITSADFAKNKESEKKLEEEKIKYE